MVITWDITIPELTGDKPRRVYIFLPEEYKDEPDKHYPVLYMFDGHNVFFDTHATYGKSWGMKKYMEKTKTEMIIAAVECDHDPNHGRIKEYSPYSFRDPYFGRITGKGKIYMDWLVTTFKPMVDSFLRTKPDRDHTFVCGSSMGGLMSLYAVLEYNSVFSKAAALSPSIWAGHKKVAHLAETAELDANTTIYMDYGSEEISNHAEMLKFFTKVTSTLMTRGAFVTSRIIPAGTHCEASWEKQIPIIMEHLLYNLD